MENKKSNLEGIEAIKKMKELVEHTRTCLMITNLEKRPFSVYPMAIQKVDENGQIYFFSQKDSDKNKELSANNEMHITISNTSDSEYLSLYGKAEVYRDQKQIDEMYSKFANNWFEGKDDPTITIIRFNPDNGQYWDTKHGKIIQLVGILIGAVTGKQMDDGLTGELKV